MQQGDGNRQVLEPIADWLPYANLGWIAGMVGLPIAIGVGGVDQYGGHITSFKDRQGRLVSPIRYRSHSRAAPRPSWIAHTTRLWPRRISPAAKTPSTLVANLPYSAFTLERSS